MSRTFLCTAGTSVAIGCPSLKGFQARPSDWDEDTSTLKAEIGRRLEKFDLGSSSQDRTRASSELNVLNRLEAKPGDEVVLFATDTADGRCCAEVLEQVLTRDFDIRRVVIERVPDLQVHDAERLRQSGLPGFSRALIPYLSDPNRRYGGGCFLCPNGGFKGVVPFMTVLGMIFRAPVVYVFEFADTLIRLPPLPVGVDRDLLARARPALRWATTQQLFHPHQFHHRIPGFTESEREWFDSFLEITPDDDGHELACLSPLAEVLLGEQGPGGIVITGAPEAAPPLLRISPLARDAIQSLGGPDRKLVFIQLRKIADPDWRRCHGTSKYTSDLDFHPTGHHPWRFAGFDSDGLFHLCWFARHNEYERQMPLPERQRAAFPPDQFTDFTVPVDDDPAKDSPTNDEQLSGEELTCQRDAALEEAAAADARNRELEQEHRRIDHELREARGLLDHANTLKTAAEREAAESHTEITRLNHELDTLREHANTLKTTAEREAAESRTEIARLNHELDTLREHANTLKTTAEQEAAESRTEIARLNHELDTLREHAAQADGLGKELRLQQESSQRLETDLAQARTSIADLQKTVTDLRHALADARRPWWRRLLARR